MSQAVAIQDPASGTLGVVDQPSAPMSPGAVRVRVSLAGVNFWEVLQQQGRVGTQVGQVLGAEGAGTVVEVADDVTDLAAGQRVAWFRQPGSYAEEVVGPASSFYAVPDAVDDETAAGLLFQGATAHYLSEETWPLGDGDVAVVTAASGGVGHLLTQLLRLRGVRVVGLVSGPEKVAIAQDLGADEVLTYDEALADGGRAGSCAAVFDAVGGSLPTGLLPWLRQRGALVTYGASSGSEAQVSAGDLVAGSFFWTRTAGKDYTRTPDEARSRAEHLLDLAAKGAVRVHVARRYPLTEAADALQALATRATTGKVLLEP